MAKKTDGLGRFMYGLPDNVEPWFDLVGRLPGTLELGFLDRVIYWLSTGLWLNKKIKRIRFFTKADRAGGQFYGFDFVRIVRGKNIK